MNEMQARLAFEDVETGDVLGETAVKMNFCWNENDRAIIEIVIDDPLPGKISRTVYIDIEDVVRHGRDAIARRYAELNQMSSRRGTNAAYPRNTDSNPERRNQ